MELVIIVVSLEESEGAVCTVVEVCFQSFYESHGSLFKPTCRDTTNSKHIPAKHFVFGHSSASRPPNQVLGCRRSRQKNGVRTEGIQLDNLRYITVGPQPACNNAMMLDWTFSVFFATHQLSTSLDQATTVVRRRRRDTTGLGSKTAAS